ncbi:hypothetical protein HME9302_02043 [Alteripontixanthobacter maritimus]|uniref:Endonuclease/exonuclease/phosphatase domain-containing protein n=1 Tax=Alteripontixanthobacter maritimus TaxID=2161824 RepID=A0A369QC66_9SPHN|nr:endonuclease/exonuclease/phosphatase family protein [Alteripontixanthobacter maritimus]RDC60827.1 hypothetical protein HME9302_02043 [Alteripontixanthobacter maritimus]
MSQTSLGGRTIWGRILVVVLLLFAVAALASQIDGDLWYVRQLDMMREPTMWLSLILAIVALTAAAGQRIWLAVGFVAVALFQFVSIWPYTRLAGTDEPEQVYADADCFTALSLNVYQDNKDHQAVLDLIAAQDPDILLLMETNKRWLDAMQPALAGYPHVLSEPLENTYGLIFASRIAVDRMQTVDNTEAETPTLYSLLTHSNGGRFEFIGLHPRPPLPGQDTAARDKSILMAGMDTRLPDVLVMGDFNDVPWSHTTSQFREGGGYRDPRAGRGSFPTFPANYAFIGWPLDHAFAKNGVTIRDYSVLNNVGADHLPVMVTACVPSSAPTEPLGSPEAERGNVSKSSDEGDGKGTGVTDAAEQDAPEPDATSPSPAADRPSQDVSERYDSPAERPANTPLPDPSVSADDEAVRPERVREQMREQ